MALTDVTLLANRPLDDTATNDSTSTVGEPSVAASGRNVFMTGNWYASSSTDAGATWTHVDPFNDLPSAAGGFCCDQLTLHDHRRSRWIWILQYSQASNTNVFRLAAKRDEHFPGGGWYWWDIGPGLLNAAWNNLWFDYPDAAISDANLYVTFNVFNSSNQWQRAVVMRFPLDTIANAGTLVFDWWSTTEVGSLRLTQGAGSTMYFGSHRSTTSLRLHRWADGEGNLTWWDIPVAEWSPGISSTAPNGVDWLARADSRITGAALGNGVITFMWTGGARANRPHAYCRAVRINESTRQVVDQPDLFSNQRAWAYPALAPNAYGAVGLSAFYGGVDRPPGHVVGVRDDGGSTWRTVYSRQGSHSPSAGRWGDYLNCRAGSPDGRTWVASGYTLEGGEDRQSIVPRFVSFGFGGATPPRLVVGNFAYDAGGWRVERHPRFLADVTGDGRSDIVGFGDAGVWVSTSNGDGSFSPLVFGVDNFGYTGGGWRVENHPRFLADVTGDRRSDIVGFGDAGVWVSLSNGDGTFTQPIFGVDNFGYTGGGWRVENHPRFLADVTGDGRADVVGFGDAGVWVSLSNGDGTFTQPIFGVDNFAYSAGGWRVENHPRFLADVTGDGRADVVGFGDAGVWVSLSNGDGTFAQPIFGVDNFGYTGGGWRVENHPRFLADVTGDGRADVVGFGDAGVWVSLSNGDGTFAQPIFGVDNFGYTGGGWRVENHPRFLADVTGDGRADVVGFGDAGVWVSLSNGDGTFTQPVMTVPNFAYSGGGWRVEKHPRLLADVTGDRKADVVGFGDAGVWVSLF